MIELKNAMEIFKILPKTNCRDCKVPTCLAFAAAVFKGEKRLEDCPHLEQSVIESYDVKNTDSRTLDRELENFLREMRSQVAAMDLPASAERLKATPRGKGLTIKALGKDFHVHEDGTITSDIHVHGWITVPLLSYVLNCKGEEPSGNWVPFRELKNGAMWAPLFGQRAEKPLKRVADSYTDLFEHMIQVFNAKRAPNAFESDIAVILHPLPRIPLLICYWKPDDGMESQLNIFFDDTAEDNLDVDSLYRITAGLVLMLEKIAYTHGG